MSYSIEWKPTPLKFLIKLSKDIGLRIIKKLDEVKKEPFRYLEHFEGEDFYKLRIGEYRFLIDVDIKNKVLKIQVFDKRGRVYKR